ncbi:MAG: translocation/assembly module TamB domain-containing protein [Deltaproteobacteria bacterium]|nr:translocation/assembly module TamB domain-containing protein [Deltaproteobacteria bacterium]
MTEKTRQIWRGVRRAVGVLAVLLGFLFLGGMGFLLWAFESGRAADLVRTQLSQQLHDGCGLESEFSELTVGLFPPKVHLSNLTVSHLDGRRVLAVEQVIATLRILPLFYGRFQFGRVAVLSPRAAVVVRGGQLLNLPVCLRDGEDAASEGNERSAVPMVVGIEELAVKRASLDLSVDDRFQARLGGIEASIASGRLGGSDLSLTIDQGNIMFAGREMPLRRLHILGHLEGLATRPRAIAVDELEMRLGDVALAGSGSVDLLGPVYAATLDVSLPLAALRDVSRDVPEVSGHAEVKIAVSGSVDAPRASGHLRLVRARVEGFGLGDEANLDFRVDRLGADVDAFDILLGGGHVRGRARVEFDEALTTSITTEAEDLSFGRVMGMVTVPGSWVDFRARGPAELKGRLNPVRLSGPFDYRVSEFRVFDRAFDAVSPPRMDVGADAAVGGGARAAEMFSVRRSLRCKGRWTFTEDGLSFRKAEVLTGETRGLVESVEIGFEAGGGLKIVADFPSFDFADLGTIAGIAFEGRGRLGVNIRGDYAHLGGTGTLELEDIAVDRVRLGRGAANVSWTNLTRLQFSSLRGRLRNTPYSGTVGVTLVDEVPLTLLGTISGGRIEDLLAAMGIDGDEWGSPAGDVSGQFDLTGPVRALTGPVDLSLAHISVVGETAETGRVIARFDRGQVIAESVELRKRQGQIFGRGAIDPRRGEASLTVRTRNAHLSDIDLLRASAPKLDGRLSLALDLAGPLSAVTGTVTATLREVRAGPERIEDGALSGLVRGSTLLLKGQLAGSGLGVAGEVRLRRNLPYRAELAFEALDVPRIVAGLEGHQAWSGAVTADLSLVGELLDWGRSSGTIRLASGRIEGDAGRFETGGPAQLRLDRGVLATDRVTLVGSGVRLVAHGRLGAEVLDLGIDGRVDLSLIQGWSPLVERAGGVLQLSSTLRGRPSNMYMVGNGRVESGLLEWRGVSQRLTGLSAELVFSQSSVLIERSVGYWAGGKLRASGRVLLDGFVPTEVDVAIQLDDTHPTLSFPEVDLSGRISGRLTLAGHVDKLRLLGDLNVQRGRARLPNLDLRAMVGRQVSSRVYDPTSEVIELNVNFLTKDGFRIRNDTTEIELQGAVTLTGTNQRWGMLGSVSAQKGGTVQFFGREYEVETGIVQFTDRYRFVPRYDVVLTTDACDARIRTNVVGTLDDSPTINSTSNPEMDEEDITSCLISGVPENLDGERLAPIASSALWQLSGVDRQVKKVIPLDQIEVSTEYSSEARAYEPRVLVAKEIMDGRLRLEYSSSLVKTTDQRVAVRWRLTPQLTLQAGWASSEKVGYGDLGVDLKRRWEW